VSKASNLDFDMVNHCNEDGRAKSTRRETRVILILSITYGKANNVKTSGVPQGLRPTKRAGTDLGLLNFWIVDLQFSTICAPVQIIYKAPAE
jgi:hypothetical protein